MLIAKRDDMDFGWNNSLHSTRVALRHQPLLCLGQANTAYAELWLRGLGLSS